MKLKFRPDLGGYVQADESAATAPTEGVEVLPVVSGHVRLPVFGDDDFAWNDPVFCQLVVVTGLLERIALALEGPAPGEIRPG